MLRIYHGCAAARNWVPAAARISCLRMMELPGSGRKKYPRRVVPGLDDRFEGVAARTTGSRHRGHRSFLSARERKPVGSFKNVRREWRWQKSPLPVNTHEVESLAAGRLCRDAAGRMPGF